MAERLSTLLWMEQGRGDQVTENKRPPQLPNAATTLASIPRRFFHSHRLHGR